MNLLDVVLPVWVKPLALVLAISAIFGYGFYRGILHEEVKFEAFQTQVSLAATQQDLKTSQRIINQKDISLATETRLNKRLTGLKLRYDGLLRANADGSRIVPPVSETPVVVNATAPVCVPAERHNTVVNEYNQLASDCTTTTVIADEWQKWATENLKE